MNGTSQLTNGTSQLMNGTYEPTKRHLKKPYFAKSAPHSP